MRQSFLGLQSESILAETRLAIVGLGGGGSHVAQQAAHVGIGTTKLFDPDVVEESNLNRLVGAIATDVAAKTPKVAIAKRTMLNLSPHLSVVDIAADWRDHFVLLHDVDVIIGCVDMYRTRFELESLARRYLIPYIDIGMDVHEQGGRFAISGQVALSLPDKPCLRCMGLIAADDLQREQYGAAGGRPQVVWTNGLLASAAVGLLVQLLTPWCEPPGSTLLRFDGNHNTLRPDGWLEQYRNRQCPHFASGELGDPFFALKPEDIGSTIVAADDLRRQSLLP